MHTWQLQTAKAKLSEVIDVAAKEGPQTITQRGVETAVLISMQEWKRLKELTIPAVEKTALEVIRGNGPYFDIPLPARGQRKRKEPIEF